MVEIDITYEGNLRCRLVHKPSGSEIRTDAPLDNHGRAEFFSPTDLAAAALGSCILTVMGIVAERHGIDMTNASARVEKHMASSPARRIGNLTVGIEFKHPIPPEKRVPLEAAALACPVARSLHPDIPVKVEFRYPDQKHLSEK